MKWLVEHWGTILQIAGAVVLVVSLINKAHAHYSQLTGPKWLRVLSAIGGVLSALTSRGVVGPLGPVKMPFTPEPKP